MRPDSFNNYINSEMLRAQQGGNVNLFNRPQVDATQLRGWNAGPGTATVYSSTYGNTAGTRAGNFTPIMTDRAGNFTGSLTEPELTAYAESVMNGAPDNLGLQIGPQVGSIDEAVSNAEKVHLLQELYYNNLMRDMYSQ